MPRLKQLFRTTVGSFICFYVLALTDVYLSVGFPETCKQVVGTSLLAGSIALLCFALPALFLRFRKILMVVELFALGLFETVELIAKLRFDTALNGDWILLSLGTSWQEVKDCLATCSLSVVLSAIVGLLLFCWVGILAVRTLDCARPRRFVLRLALMIGLIVPYCSMVFLYRLQGNETTYLGGFGALRFLHDSAKMFQTYLAFDAVRHAPKYPAGFPAVSAEALQRNPVYVFGIGESLTRNHMSLYGYGRKTTPALDGLGSQLIVYSDCVARYRYTEWAVSSTFIHFDKVSGLPDYTLPQTVKSAGYECVRLSMQKSWSARSLVDGVLFYDVESYGDYLVKEGMGYDDRLLPLLEREIAAHHDRPLVIFLHFRGSHFEYDQRYPKDSGTVFRDDAEDACTARIAGTLQKFNRYDNSICFSDMVMSSVIQILSSTQRPSFFMFYSDHGESPSAFYPRESVSPDVWEIPLFFWFSSEYRAQYPQIVDSVVRCRDAPLQADQLLGGMLTLLHITSLPSEDFLSSQFVPRKCRVVDECCINYDKALKGRNGAKKN